MATAKKKTKRAAAKATPPVHRHHHLNRQALDDLCKHARELATNAMTPVLLLAPAEDRAAIMHRVAFDLAGSAAITFAVNNRGVQIEELSAEIESHPEVQKYWRGMLANWARSVLKATA